MGGWMGGWVWLEGPRVVSVAWLNVVFSSVKKTSLFVKSPQEQNVPLLQEHVTCAKFPCVSLHMCLYVCPRVCVFAEACLVAGLFGLSGICAVTGQLGS